MSWKQKAGLLFKLGRPKFLAYSMACHLVGPLPSLLTSEYFSKNSLRCDLCDVSDGAWCELARVHSVAADGVADPHGHPLLERVR